MTIDDMFKVVSLILASFGGGALIVVGLTKWLGNVWAGRILQTEQVKLDKQLEGLRHELGLTKSSYEHHLDLILDYYATFYKHYRRCQRTAFVDAHRELPGGEMKFTKDEFITSLGEFLADWSDKEGRIRLLLPSTLLALHEKAVTKFNDFKRAVHDFTPAEQTPRKKELVFHEIDEIKTELENGLREFLRTESLLK